MSARLISGSQALRFALPVKPRAIEVTLGRVIRRCGVVEPSARLVHPFYADHVKGAVCDQLLRPAVPANKIRVTPAILLADPDKAFAVLDPIDVVAVNVEPGVIAVGQDVLHLSGLGVADKDSVCVLQ